MPVVPFTSRKPGADGSIAPTPPPLPWGLIAAAQMHSEDRLIEVRGAAKLPASVNIEDRRGEHQPEGDAVDVAAEAAALRTVKSVTNRVSKHNEPMEEIK